MLNYATMADLSFHLARIQYVHTKAVSLVRYHEYGQELNTSWSTHTLTLIVPWYCYQMWLANHRSVSTHSSECLYRNSLQWTRLLIIFLKNLRMQACEPTTRSRSSLLIIHPVHARSAMDSTPSFYTPNKSILVVKSSKITPPLECMRERLLKIRSYIYKVKDVK